MTNLAFNCPHCRTASAGFTYVMENQRDKSHTNILFRCNVCGDMLVIVALSLPNGLGLKTLLDRGGQQAIVSGALKIVARYPQPPAAHVVEYLPNDVAAVFEKAQTDFVAGRLEQACMMFRKVLDKATKQLLGAQAVGQNLNNRIDMLASQRKLTTELKEWAHQLRSAGNDFIHDDEPTKQDADDMELLTRMFLIYTFTLPGMLASRQATAQAAAATAQSINSV